MAVGRSSDTLNMTVAGINFVFNEAAKAPQKREYEALVTKVEEPRPIGIYLTAGDIGNAVLLTEGDAINFQGIAQGYKTEITTLTYAQGVAATRKAMLDDQTNTIKNAFGTKLINSMLAMKEQVVADAYNHGFTVTGSDGKAIFADDHPLLSAPGKVNDNLVSGPLSVEKLKEMQNRFVFIKNHAGNPYPTHPTTIVTHPSEQFKLIELLNSQLLPWELSNTVNSLNDVNKIQIVLNNYIDNTGKGDTNSPYFMLDKTIDRAGAILQTRGGLKLDVLEDFKTKDWQGTCIEEYACAFVSPGYGVVGSTGI